MVVGDGLPESATRGAALRAVEPDGSHPARSRALSPLRGDPHIFQTKKRRNPAGCVIICLNGGGGWIRTIEVRDGRFTVYCIWPLCNPTNFQMERVKGIEPSRSAWKAEVLPLNYTRIQLDVI